MVITTFTPTGTSSTVLGLSKASWRVAISISKFDHVDKIIESTVKDLGEELKSLGNECDLMYDKLEGVANKSEVGSPPPYDVDDKIWKRLATQVEEASAAVRELEHFIKSLREQESPYGAPFDEGERLMRSDKSKRTIAQFRTEIWRHTENLRAAMQLMEM